MMAASATAAAAGGGGGGGGGDEPVPAAGDARLVRARLARAWADAIARGPPALAPAPTADASDANAGELKLTSVLVWGAARVASALAALSPAVAPPPGGAPAVALGGGADSLLVTHAVRLPPRRAGRVVALVAGGGRANALAKDSSWVTARAPLEALLTPELEEVLMTDGAGGLLEGTQTNVFALERDGALATAGEGVLEGTVRALALEVARAAGLRVRLRAPAVADAASWRGAFLTSTSRLVLPLDGLRLADGAEVRLERGPGVAALEAAVRAAVEARSSDVAAVAAAEEGGQ